eukprot:TRINITY_DN108804_c0_g1_i1.p1 TRINITY_DN108804_c0_g1~~TRINITY_DN108804_c0_g1_i1.p1  ORF type:complete len:194 (+),score=31.02 TRINITY_DN108804_c0_g1_i1:18-599(+)
MSWLRCFKSSLTAAERAPSSLELAEDLDAAENGNAGLAPRPSFKRAATAVIAANRFKAAANCIEFSILLVASRKGENYADRMWPALRTLQERIDSTKVDIHRLEDGRGDVNSRDQIRARLRHAVEEQQRAKKLLALQVADLEARGRPGPDSTSVLADLDAFQAEVLNCRTRIRQLVVTLTAACMADSKDFTRI